MQHFIFGKLTWDALPHVWYTVGGALFMAGAAIGVAIFLTRRKLWGWLWHDWLTSTDPKKIGIMYIIVATLMLARGAIDAIMILFQQAMASGASSGYLDPAHFQQIFTAHGDIMVFFVTTGFLFGLMNLIVPLQIGARDLAFPFINSLGFWLYVAGAALINLFFVFGGDFAGAGWLSLPPLVELQYSPGVGVDYWIWSLQISGIGSLIAGINFLVTILKLRAPGMTLMKMPLFTWAALCSAVLIISVFPVLTVTIALLNLDRFFGMHFFTSGFGGNPMMYVNLIWMWGHPEVYILMLPSFGIYSEIVSTFSQKRLYGYVTAVCALIGVTVLSFAVWLHHFFTMGAGADVNAFFGIMTMFIAVPTGVQIYNWIRTMHGGKIIFKTPMYWFLGFIGTFTIGGMAGMLMASPAADFELHNSLFLVAHFHTMVIGGALFGIFAGITYWFPKFTGFKLNERLGRHAFWCWIIGFFVTFVPFYILGFLGATRRMDHYAATTHYQPLFIISAIGACISAIGFALQIAQIIVSVKKATRDRRQGTREEYRETRDGQLPVTSYQLPDMGDPWSARTLEWATSSPPPEYNFAVIPEVRERDAFWEMKNATRDMEQGKWKKEQIEASEKPVTSYPLPVTRYQDIVLGGNTPMAIYISGFAFLIGFGFVWDLVWLIIAGLVGAIACIVIRSFDEHTEHVIPAAEVERMELERATFYG